MFWKRQTEGSVLCSSCGNLVGVNDEKCFHCGRRNPSLWGFGGAIRALGRDLGFVQLVITGSIVLYIASLALDLQGIRGGGFMSFLSPSWTALFLLGGSGYEAVFVFGRFWTVLSAGWLHGGLLHILFNMMWVRNLAPPTAEFYGPGRMVIIYTVSSIAGFAFSSVANAVVPFVPVFGSLLGAIGLAGAFRTVGASAPIFGLLGALVYYGRRTGHQAVYKQTVGYAVILGLFGLVFPLVDNQAHLGGFVGGYVAAKLLDPLRPERGDHLAVAVVCLVLTALSIVASVVTGLKHV
jgi:rhomboid protease GluP